MAQSLSGLNQKLKSKLRLRDLLVGLSCPLAADNLMLVSCLQVLTCDRGFVDFSSRAANSWVNLLCRAGI